MREINPPRRPFPRRLAVALGALALALTVGLISLPDRVSAEAPDRDIGGGQQYQHRNWHGGRMVVYPPGQPAVYGVPPQPYYYRHQTASCGANTVAGVAIGAGVGGLIGSQLSDRPGDAGPTVFGMLVGAVLGGALGQSADRANGC